MIFAIWLKGRKPSIKHDYYVYWIVKELANKGHICRVAKIGEAKPDIQIISVNTAIEVELGKSNINKNIKNSLEKFERLIICSDSKKLIKSLSEKNKDSRVLFSEIWGVPSLI